MFTKDYQYLNLTAEALAEMGYGGKLSKRPAGSSLEARAKQLLDNEEAVPGIYYQAEQKMAGVAVATNASIEDLMAVLTKCWPGWYDLRRGTRLFKTFNGITRKEQRNGSASKVTRT